MHAGIINSVNERTQLAGYNRLALLLFRLGNGVHYGINVFKVREVIPMPDLRWMPGAHPIVRGVACVRDRLISVLDLAQAIGVAGDSQRLGGHLVVTEFNRSVQGFQVEAVERIINVDMANVRPPREDGDDCYLTAVTRLEDMLVEVIDVEKVLAEVLVQNHRVAGGLVDAVRELGNAPRRVLVADDSRVARGQIANTLEQLGLEVVLVNNGREALQMLKSMAETVPDIARELLMVISDVEMPDMDGYTLTTEIRRDPKLSGLFVLLHTSLSGMFNHSMVAQVGADRFVPKFSSDGLASGVLERLNMLN
ncbi:MAG: chemotaxis protein CheW [Salinisphaeraceae bacterium]|jgi:two-component system chemotaxis response regulator CheV|nr:chemotaxis protein CheW [Salinisphaeraceae bacterium]